MPYIKTRCRVSFRHNVGERKGSRTTVNSQTTKCWMDRTYFLNRRKQAEEDEQRIQLEIKQREEERIKRKQEREQKSRDEEKRIKEESAKRLA